MAKLLNALIMILMIEVGLFLFQGGTTSATNLMGLTVTFPGVDALGIAARDISLITGFIVALGILTGVGIFVGTFSNTVTFVIYAVPAIAFLGLAAVITQLALFISGSLEGANPLFVVLANAIIIIPLTIYYAMAVMEWVRANQ